VRADTGLELRGIRFVMVQDCVDSAEFHHPAHFLLLNYTAEAESEAVVLNDEAEAAVMDLNMPTRVLLDRCV
jgi:hypothetical protein